MKPLHSNLKKLITILNDCQYHDGNSLGAKLGISRAAVWKWINWLKQEHIELDIDKSRGYCLTKPCILLDTKKIRLGLNKKFQQSLDLYLFAATASTNQFFKTYSFNTRPFALCIAEKQTAGRGRLQRSWFSPFAENIYASFCYELNQDISQLAGLSLVISLIIMKTLNRITGSEDFKIKWPNDVYYRNCKIAGTLIEIDAQSHDKAKIIIGIGININMKSTLKEIKKPYTSLYNIYGEVFDRNETIAVLVKEFINTVNLFSQHEFQYFKNEYERQHMLQGQNVCLEHIHNQVSGKVMGINEKGHLILKLDSGEVKNFTAGDLYIQ